MKRNLTRRSSQRNDDETKEHQQEKLKDDDEGNLTPQKLKLEEEEQQSPQTPKSDFTNFAESILSPNALDTPIVSFADVLTPREWSPFGLDMLSATKSKSLSFGGMDLFDNENVSNHSKKFFKEARSLASLSSPASPDIIRVKEPASVHTQRSATKYRDLFNSPSEHLDSRHLPFLDEGNEDQPPRTISTRSQSRSSQQGSSDEDGIEKAAAGILEMKSSRGKKRARSPSCVEETKETRSTPPQIQLQTLQVPSFDQIRSSTPVGDPTPKIPPHPSLNSSTSMTRSSNLLLPRDDHRITTPHTQGIQDISTSISPELPPPSSSVTCNCKKSRCLKLYCDCFRLQKYCFGCNCKDCANLKTFEKERIAARIAITDRNPEAFKPRIAIFDHKKSLETYSPRSSSAASSTSSSVIGLHQSGCHCKKSACLKKYCECFQAGVPCHDRCRCQDCQNTHELHQGNTSHASNKLRDSNSSGLLTIPKVPLAANARLPTQIHELPQLFTSSQVSDDKPVYNKAQAEQAALDIVCAFLRGQIVVPGLSPSTFVPNPSLSEDLPEILKQLAPGCFTPHSSENSLLATPSQTPHLPTSTPPTLPPHLLLKTEKENL